ncbi:MAG: ABC transporter permease [Bacilli bacterium]|nr:ABC transporter permease [Bacilli bacterium]
MFFHNFIYSLKVLLGNKTLIFWSFAFPIVLGFLFNLAFKDIEKNESFNTFDIAIIESPQFSDDVFYKEAYKSLSNGDDRIFNITMTNKDDAEKMLADKEITGYLEFLDSVSITVNQSGIYETILRFVVDEIESNKKMISTLVKDKLQTAKPNEVANIIEGIKDKVINGNATVIDKTRDNMSYTMIEYYTLIAMSALYGGVISMYIINLKLANMGSVGKRTAVAAIKKGTLIISSLLASYLVQLVEIALIFIFTVFVLHVDYGNEIGFVILTSLVGSLAGLALGVLVATLFKTNENAKIGILIAITMLGCFLSGMMGITMKYIVDTYAPFVNMINPASLITDAFYALYYYGVNNRFIQDILSLIIISALMIILSWRGLRRQKYDAV